MPQMLHRLLTWRRPLLRDAFYQKISKKTFLFYSTVLFTKFLTLEVKGGSTVYKTTKIGHFTMKCPIFCCIQFFSLIRNSLLKCLFQLFCMVSITGCLVFNITTICEMSRSMLIGVIEKELLTPST